MTQLRDQSTMLVDTLRMTDRDLLRVLAALAGSGAKAGAEADARSAVAVANYPRVVLRLRDQLTGVWTAFLVKPRVIHEHGLTFLHGGYVHKDVRGAVLLRDAAGLPTQITVAIMACRHLTGRLHEAVATFERNLDLGQFQFADGSLLNQPASWNEAHAPVS